MVFIDVFIVENNIKQAKLMAEYWIIGVYPPEIKHGLLENPPYRNL